MINTDKLKNIISKKAKGDSDISQKYYQLYYFEKILERISISKYKGQIILKGGLLLTSIIGDDERTTKDMDATLKGIPLTRNDVQEVFEEILNIDLCDGVTFKIISIKDIRLEDEYGGFRLNILSQFGNNKTYIAVELTTGDVITPREMKYNYNSIFEDKKIPLLTYTLETVLAEKFQSVITRGVFNTRQKDFYDIYVLMNFKKNDIDDNNLKQAIYNTFKKRETIIDIENIKEVSDILKEDENMSGLWKSYVSKNLYANGITFKDTIEALNLIIDILSK
ncbi:MAG: abortive phage infection protein [Clostridiaceae bacterium]|nr:MAG: abortive phage infection protein [Clostridiaceae bacterium]